MTAESKHIGGCPECGTEVRLKKTPYIGQIINCRRCDAVLQVNGRFPLTFVWAEASWVDADDFADSDNRKPDRRRHGRS